MWEGKLKLTSMTLKRLRFFSSSTYLRVKLSGFLSNFFWHLPQYANYGGKSWNDINIQAYTCLYLKTGLVLSLVLPLSQQADSFTRHTMAGMQGGQKGRGRALRRHGGGRGSRWGSRYWKEAAAASYWLSLCWFLFVFVLCPVPNLTFLIQITGGKWTCLETKVAFLGVKHTILHALTWRASWFALQSVAGPFYCQQKMFN